MIDQIAAVPSFIAQIEAQFAQFTPSTTPGTAVLPAPSDPFSVLLDAATGTSGSSGTSTTSESASSEVDPQLVSLVSASPAALETPDAVIGSSASGSAIV